MSYTARLSRLLRSKRQRGRHKQTVDRSFHMHSAVTCTSALATGTIRAVFSTSKVCQDALFIKHKYAQDDYNWMNSFNQVSNVGKNTDIIATLMWVRLVHKCQIVKYWKQIESIRGRHKQTVYRSFHMHRAVTCTSALATGTIRAVFSTSKVCQDALFIKHKYAQDDYNWMN